MTNLNRISTFGHSGASIMMAGLGVKPNSDDFMEMAFYRALRRIHKKEVLELCEAYSRRKGLRLEQRVLP